MQLSLRNDPENLDKQKSLQALQDVLQRLKDFVAEKDKFMHGFLRYQYETTYAELIAARTASATEMAEVVGEVKKVRDAVQGLDDDRSITKSSLLVLKNKLDADYNITLKDMSTLSVFVTDVKNDPFWENKEDLEDLEDLYLRLEVICSDRFKSIAASVKKKIRLFEKYYPVDGMEQVVGAEQTDSLNGPASMAEIIVSACSTLDPET